MGILGREIGTEASLFLTINLSEQQLQLDEAKMSRNCLRGRSAARAQGGHPAGPTWKGILWWRPRGTRASAARGTDQAGCGTQPPPTQLSRGLPPERLGRKHDAGNSVALPKM